MVRSKQKTARRAFPSVDQQLVSWLSFTALLGGKEHGDSRSAHTGDREQLAAKATAPVLQHLSGGDCPRGILGGSSSMAEKHLDVL